MRAVFALLVLIASSSSATLLAPPKDEWKAAADALEKESDKSLSGITPGVRTKLDKEVEISATDEMQARARHCGTSLVFSNELAFSDRTVWISPGATTEQIACVQRSSPFVKAPAR